MNFLEKIVGVFLMIGAVCILLLVLSLILG